MNWLILLISISATLNIALGCNRAPQGTSAAKSPVDDNFVVGISGNPDTYIPGQKYNVTLTAYNGLSFTSFMLTSENENQESNDVGNVGSFEIIDLTETRFSPRCPNLVENTNTNFKTHIDAVWVAPINTGNGCILLRATVVQHRDVWFMDDGFLTKKICEEEIDDIDNQPSILQNCCACDEAKYELTFEGKWSRHTHPKDFPANSWRTRFSDIIGASHTIDYRFWKYGELASEGLREVAEHGSTRTLESELKKQSDQIRTIIKARGIAYPNVTGKTFAVFRVDSHHHLISLVSMIDPSPDWIVGVSGLELCLPNCSWVENKIHNLYPWDTGTDSGPSYMSADQPQIPPDVIRRIKSNFPNDPRSPFYESSGAPMKPLATLHINRRRLYEKTCEHVENENESNECATNHWSRWGECSAKCGPGKQYRTREFKNPTMAHRFKCRNNLREEQSCTGVKCGGLNTDADGDARIIENNYSGGLQENPECAISEWGDWSSCSVTCGEGISVRHRHYLIPKARKKCQKVRRVPLQEERKCEGINCGGDIDKGNENIENNPDAIEAREEQPEDFGQPDNNNEDDDNDDDEARYRRMKSFSQKREDYIPPECGVSNWSDFSPCIGKCGNMGQSERERKVWNLDEVYNVRKPDDDGSDPCEHIKRHEVVNCSMPNCDTIVPPYCYEQPKRSHCRDNDITNFWFYDHSSDQCGLFAADKCDRTQNKFTSKEMCEEVCMQPRKRMNLKIEDLRLEHHPVDCVVSEWKTHPCNTTCGEGIQVKTRIVLRSAKYGGKPCPKYLVRFDKCYLRCDDDIYSVRNSGLGNIENKRRGKLFITKQPIEFDECRYSEWSAWTPCTASCGDNSVRQRTRTLLNNEFNYKCKDRVRIEKCTMMPCLLNSNDDDDRW